jgi:hypothetical protein
VHRQDTLLIRCLLGLVNAKGPKPPSKGAAAKRHRLLLVTTGKL